MNSTYVNHTFLPEYDEESRILILGTMPSPKSRELGFYYGHPRNRFWPVLVDILGEPLPQTNEEKRELLHRRHIALWDVLAGCEIQGADDNSIRNPRPNDMTVILSAAPIQAIFTTGAKASALYKKYCYPSCGVPSISLPSTSPANCRLSYDALKTSYESILPYLYSPDATKKVKHPTL